MTGWSPGGARLLADADLHHVGKRTIVSVAVILISIGVQMLLKFVSTSGSGSPWDKTDLILWMDLTNTAVISFSVYAATQVKSAQFSQYQLLALVGVVLFACAIIPTCIRWYGTDASGAPRTWQGIWLPNIMSSVTVVVAIVFGVNFAG